MILQLAPDEQVVQVGWSYGLPGEKDSGAGAWFFAVKDTVLDVKAALRQAVQAYLDGPDYEPPDHPFNWGDAINDLEERHWAAFGLRLLDPFPGQHGRVSVDHDEAFAPRKRPYPVPPAPE